MDVEKFLRRVVNVLAVAVLATAAVVALVVVARGDPGVGSRSPTVRPSLVSERSVALERGSRDRGLGAEAADPAPRAKPKAKARPAVQRKVPPAAEREASPVAQPEPAAGVEHDGGRAEGEHEEEDRDDEEWEGEEWEGEESED